jgi:hypothetical protein
MRPHLFSAILVSAMALLGSAQAQDVRRQPAESDAVFVARVLHIPADRDLHVTEADWNGVPTLFADYETADADPERLVTALQRQPSGAYRALSVTVGEQEGAVPDIAAIGFARASKDTAKALIVILSWAQEHYDVSGTLYEVRIFAAPKTGQSQLDLLKISDHFGTDCDCDYRDGTSKHYRFKTIAAVKAELGKLGY